MTDHNSYVPLYQQVFDILKNKIFSEEIQKGEKIPSERELCELYNVSRITIRQALDLLEKEGLIFTVPGCGTFANDGPIDQNLMHVTSFSKTLQQKGLVASTAILSYDETLIPGRQLVFFGLGQGGNPCRLDILGLADKLPIVYYQSYLQLEVGRQMHAAALQMVEAGEAFSTFDLYERINCPISHIEQQIFAEAADAFLAQTLRVKLGQPLLKLLSYVYGSENEPLEYKIGYYRSDKYAFSIKRSV